MPFHWAAPLNTDHMEPGVTDSQRVLDAIRRLVRHYRLFDRLIRSEIGISSAQLSALSAIAQSPSLSLGELAARTSTDQSSVSVVTSVLVESGLVRRDRDPRDSRRLALHPTQAGLALLRRVPVTFGDEIRVAASGLAPNDRHHLAAMLELIVESLASAREEILVASPAIGK